MDYGMNSSVKRRPLPSKKVLILPGGGVFGVIISGFLKGYDPLGSIGGSINIDAVGGTSVGSILACMYGAGLSFGTVHDKLCEGIPDIFRTSWFNRNGVWGPRHDAAVLERWLERYLMVPFGVLKPAIFCTSIELASSKIKVFVNFAEHDDLRLPAWQVARASSAAPTYFSPFDCKGTAYVDGGLFENIPVVSTCCGIRSKMDIALDQQDVFVIGTGIRGGGKYKPCDMAGWGLLSWSQPMVEMLTRSNEMSSAFIGRQLQLRGLKIFNPIALEDEWAMNQPGIVPRLLDLVSQNQSAFNKEFSAWLTRKA